MSAQHSIQSGSPCDSPCITDLERTQIALYRLYEAAMRKGREIEELEEQNKPDVSHELGGSGETSGQESNHVCKQ